ncbi:MAG: DEAD/DEAH box helicase [Leptospiraceae bacterium]|nr:DEAD/DEAH box helicase [Leptospiraceae bacterium]NUM41614.1 DEAD/DEAH box helicase [Leptospiraceae bacterium]
MSDNRKISSYIKTFFEKEIRFHKLIDKEHGDFSDFPKELNEKLKNVLIEQGFHSLYSHQKEAFHSISREKDTVLVSRTASGKTLSFLLPILNDYIQKDPPFSVMMMYPTKALSRDQEGTLGKLLQAATDSRKIGTFDGDTSREEREKILKSADFIITNPDMLHSGILPNHNRKWKNILSRLKYIVVDEVHTYRGSFGSHVSNVFKRLLRVCEIYGSKPIFVCSSATIGNPKEHVELLFQRKFEVIEKDGSPRPNREIFLINPSLVKSQGETLYRKGTGSISIPLMRYATKFGIRTICFCKGRQEVERLYRAVTDRNEDLREKIKPYRGGLLPNERRQLEKDLFSGKINTIITTNALELGIDIGDMSLCILSGHPGTVASFWQQAGRVGRKGNHSFIVFIAKDTPIDQYIVNHPDFITSTPSEEAWLNPENPYILLQHLPCAAYEYPLTSKNKYFHGEIASIAIDTLLKKKMLSPYGESFRYSAGDYPARGVNLRGMTDYNIDIYCGTEVIGEIDPIGARGALYKDAIYQHLGKKYMSLDLDLEKKLCKVEWTEVDYFTEAVWENMIQMIDEDESKVLNESELKFGYIEVKKQPKLYKKIKEKTHENIGYGPITLDSFDYETTGFTLTPSMNWVEKMNVTDRRYIDSALFGLSYILKRISPVLCMADSRDIETDVGLPASPNAQFRTSIFVYDAQEGGAGYSEKIYEKIIDAMNLCYTILEECECDSGCPSCVPPLPPGISDRETEDFLTETNAAIECTKSIILSILKNEIYIPKIKKKVYSISHNYSQYNEDYENRKKSENRLERAANSLIRKREKVH